MSLQTGDESVGVYILSAPKSAIANNDETDLIDENQLTTKSADLRQLRKDVLEYASNNPGGFKFKGDIKSNSMSSRDGSIVYDQNEEYQRMVINNEVTKDQGELEMLFMNDESWGWVIVFGSFLCMMIVDGICFSHGLHLNWIKSYFCLKSNSLAVLPGSLMSGLYQIISPFDNILANLLSYRTVAMSGCVVASVSLLISSIIKNYLLFTLCFGIFTGVGFGLMYLPAIAIVAHWFNQFRAVAIGISLCGSGMGIIFLSFLLPSIISQLTGNAALIILSAICFQSLLGIALFRPYELHQRIKQIQEKRKQENKAKLDLKNDRKRIKNEKKIRKSMNKEQKRREKIAAKKKIVITRGSIFTRIMEEKNRQRNVSTGSLDGMLITQMNQLVTASQVDMGGNLSINGANYGATSLSSIATDNHPVLPAKSLERVVENTLRILKSSPNRTSTSSNLQSYVGNRFTKKSSTNSMIEMIQKEIIPDEIPFELIKEYMERQNTIQKCAKEEIETSEKKNASFRIGSTNVLQSQSPRFSLNGEESHINESAECEDTFSLDKQSLKNLSKSPSTNRQNSNSVTSGSQNQLGLSVEVKEAVRTALLEEIDKPISRRDLYYSGSFHHMVKTDSQSRIQLPINNNGYGITVTSLNSNSYKESPKRPLDDNELTECATNNSSGKNQTKKCYDILWCSEFMDFKLYKNIVFQLLIGSSILMMMGFGVPFFFLPNFLRNYATYWTSLSLTILGLSNMVGRLVATFYIEKSWAFEHKTANAVNLTLIFLFVASISLTILPICSENLHISMVIILSFMYGFSVSMVVSIRSMLVVELFGVANLTKCFTSLLIFQGLASILGPFISGLICDFWEDGVFIFGGASFFFSTLFIVGIRNTHKKGGCCKNRMISDELYVDKMQNIRSASASILNRQNEQNGFESPQYDHEYNETYDNQTTQTTNVIA